ncbi:MAG: TerB family tellurite resistance protein [Sphingomonadales bacterium]|nr:TerB family tellurite resistance protein [Sphingomonadales bacterium]
MSIWGKIIGGAAGFALGGPLGLLVGAGVGHAVDRGIQSVTPDEQEGGIRKITFTIGVIALCAKMAKADGVVTDDEIEAFQRLFHIPPHEARNVERVYNMARQDTAGFETYARQIGKLFADKPVVLEELVDALFYIAHADGVLHPNELEFIRAVAGIFEIGDATFSALAARYLGPEHENPYTLLGLDRTASDEEIKSAYRKLAKEHHPDRLIAQGLPEEFVQVANDRLAAINEAYDKLAAERGLK